MQNATYFAQARGSRNETLLNHLLDLQLTSLEVNQK